MSQKQAQAFLRKVMGPPTKTLEGNEREQILLLLSVMEPFKETNNQHSWTSYYMIGKREYHITTFPGSDIIVDEILKD